MICRHSVCRLLPVVVIVLAASVAAHAAAATPQGVSGRVTDVTLYRSQAMVTRTVPLDAPAGSVELVVGELPEHVVTGSLFAEGSEGVEVRAVRFRTRAVGQEPREEVRTLDEAIAEVNQNLKLAAKKQELLAKKAAYLDALEGFVAPTAKIELSKGVLDAEALKEVTTFSFEQRQSILTEQVEVEKETELLKEKLTLLQRQRAELTNGASRTVREAVLFLEKRNAEKETVRVKYLVDSCGWSPTYTLRAGQDRAAVQVECNGLIRQITGEDWQGVSLTLSTASPALSATGPGLAPFDVALTANGDGAGKAKQNDLARQLQSIRGRQQSAILEFRNTLDLTGNIGKNWEANSAANEFQSLELTNPKSALAAVEDVRSIDGPSLSYRLPAAVSLASRSDQQMVRILQTSLPCSFYHVATPVLTGHVYREAELTNSGQEDLLAGPITVYLDGSFVGRGEIPTVTRGEAFVVGFGADPQLRSRRKLANKTDGVQGGNRELGFDYRLVIENYGATPLPVRVFDRLPYTQRSSDIRITLGEMKDPLSKDKLYLRRERTKGILRWDVQVAALASGEDARVIEYGFTIDFDRNFTLSAAGSNTPKQQMEFEQLQRARFKR